MEKVQKILKFSFNSRPPPTFQCSPLYKIFSSVDKVLLVNVMEPFDRKALRHFAKFIAWKTAQIHLLLGLT